MSVLKRKSSIALLTGIIAMLLLIPLWYTILVPYLIASNLENIDETTTIDGTVEGFVLVDLYGPAYIRKKLQIRIEAHAYTEKVRGDNIIMKVESRAIRTDTNETLEYFSGNSTYVFNKFTREYVPDAPEEDPDVNRTGYGATLYPPHLKEGEDIPNVWIDGLDTVGTLEFNGTVVEEGVTLYRYTLNITITKMMDLQGEQENCTLTSTKIILIEPLMGAPAYIQNETFFLGYTQPPLPPFPFIYLEYRFSDDAIAQGIENAKMAYNGAQITEIYVPTIFGVVTIILTIGLILNVRRLGRKKPPRPETQSSASHTR